MSKRKTPKVDELNFLLEHEKRFRQHQPKPAQFRPRKRKRSPEPVAAEVEILLEDALKLASTKATLPKLILIANVYRQLYLVWPALSPKARKPLKDLYYLICRPVISCVVQCCDGDLVEFHRRWVGDKSVFLHSRFSDRCPGQHNVGMECGYYQPPTDSASVEGFHDETNP
jgi:hypothetical protein